MVAAATRRRKRFLILVVILLGLAGGAYRLLFVSSARGRPARAPMGGVRTIHATTSTGRHGAYYLPSSYESRDLPLLVMLHGTGGTGAGVMARLRPIAERERFFALAPDSVSIAGVWLVDQSSHGANEDYRHVMGCVRDVLALPRVRLDRAHVLVAGFSVGAAVALHVASHEELFTAFAVLHGHVVADAMGPRRVRGWLSTGDRDRLRTVASIRSIADYLTRRAGIPEIETRVFSGDHALGEDELAALVTWWLHGPDGSAAPR